MTTKQVADRLGVGMRWIQALIKDGRLPAERVGRDYLIDPGHIKLIADLKPTGRPRKDTATPPAKKARRKGAK